MPRRDHRARRNEILPGSGPVQDRTAELEPERYIQLETDRILGVIQRVPRHHSWDSSTRHRTMKQSKPVYRHPHVALHPLLLATLLLPLSACGNVTPQEAVQENAPRSAQAAVNAQVAADARAAQGQASLPGDPDSTETLFDG